MIGQVFTRLTVLGFSHRDHRHRKFWRVRCVCGTEKTVQTALLRSGNTKSCGCLAREHLDAGRRRLPAEGGVVNQIILGIRRHARDRGFSYDLPRELVDELIRQPCHYCGDRGSNVKVTKNYRQGFQHNGLDRVDSKKGYEPTNVVPCCRTCNNAKRDMDRNEFIAWATKVAAMAAQWGSIALEQAA